MNYFSIAPSKDHNEIGHYPQISLATGYDRSSTESYSNVKFNSFPDFSPELELALDPKAKPTDLLDRVGPTFGLLVSEKLKNVLAAHQLPPHHFYPIKVRQNAQEVGPFFWFHFLMGNPEEHISFKASTIKVRHTGNPKNEVILPCMSAEYFKGIHEHFQDNFEFQVLPDTIMGKENFPEYDVLNLGLLYWDVLISSRLKTSLEEIGITGLKTKLFKPLRIK